MVRNGTGTQKGEEVGKQQEEGKMEIDRERGRE
jgi:hypothetical protein